MKDEVPKPMDKADEIARDLWQRTWDWERPEGMAMIANALREYGKAERERIATFVGKHLGCDQIAAKIREGE